MTDRDTDVETLAPPHADGPAATLPYTIELVPVDRGWILEKIAQAIAREAAERPDRYRVSVTSHPTGRAELTFFLPESAWRDDLAETLRVTYLAHKEDHAGAAALFEEVARKSDCCVTSSSKYAEVLARDGAREVVTIPLGVDTEVFVPNVRIGVVGRTYHTGRKGESLLASVMDLPFVEFVFTGEGWPRPAQHYGEQDLARFYQSLDYLLVPSLIEGGPVPMLEALASGCPVIAPTDVGMVRDFPHIPFRRGDAQDLRRVLQAELDRTLALRAAALPCDWRHFARRHLELFERLIDQRRRAAGTSRSRRRAPFEAPHPRVLLVTHGPEEAAKGGPTTRVRNIVAHLRGRGLPVDCIGDRARIAAEHADVIHVFNSWPPDSALATLVAARRTGARVVFSPIALDLTDWPLFHPFMEKLLQQSAGSEDDLRSALRAIQAATSRRAYADGRDVPVEGLPGLFEKLRLCCDLADRLVFLSEYERAYLAAIGARVDHGVLVRNGVDVDTMAAGDPALFRARYGVERYVLTVGRLEYRKNQAVAALAARDADVPLVLVGATGDGGYVDHIKRLGRNVRIVERIEERALLASAYAGAAAFVFPSWTEGAPLAAMEAGAAGTPLIVGDLSSERELFADDARYVHPADVAALHAAIAGVLANPESAERRAARARRFTRDFAIARHADETWSVYEALHVAAGRDEPDRAVVADVSALLHFVRVGQPFTGVPLAERNILREIAAARGSLPCIVYNDTKARFIPVHLDELDRFDAASFDAQRWFAQDDDVPRERRATLEFADRTQPVLPVGIEPARPRTPRLRTRAIALLKHTLQRAPTGVRDPAVKALRRLRPNFDPFQMPPEHVAVLASRDPQAVHQPAVPIDTASPAVVRFEHALGRVAVHEVPRYPAVVPVGARLLTLGQSWLSNAPLLDELIRLTETRALSLEPYVYDLSYHTGAHYTGWTDNHERFDRVLRLLQHSRRVYTESRQVENELQKLRASRGFTYATRRTRLRGREFDGAQVSAAGLRYPPDTFVLVVSSFNKRKNHDFLIRVWQELHETWIAPAGKPYRLVLVGQVQEERQFGDPPFVARLALSNIDVLTAVADPQLAWLMRHCAFAAYPSLREGWGLPAQESLMCGKVCLVSSVLPVAEEIDNPALVRLAPDDFYGWYEALKTWLDNASMRAAFAARARDYEAPAWRDIAAPLLVD